MYSFSGFFLRLNWIYGHSHRNMPEINFNGTQMLRNQLGVVQYGEC
jgi:hypothetical protein